MTIQVKTHTDIHHPNAARPESVMLVQDPEFRSGGHLWEGDYSPGLNHTVQVKALTSAISWIEVTWPEPTTILGVQLYGDTRGGWGRIRIDGNEVWRGSTYAAENLFTDYIEFSNLSEEPHTIRVEALGQVGTSGGTNKGDIYVGVTAFGRGAVSIDNKTGDGTDIFVPAWQ